MRLEKDWGRLGLKLSDWKKVKLSELGTIVGGGTPSTKKEEYYGGDIPWITPKDLANFGERYIEHGSRNITLAGLENSSAKILPVGSILFSSRAPIGYIAIASNNVSTNQGFKSIIPNSDVDSLFLYYLLKFNKDKIENMGSGTTFKEVSASIMKSIEVFIPTEIVEQRKISAILGAIDDKIENNKKINHHLEQMAQAIFKSWFVDFEPFGGVKPFDWQEGVFSEIVSSTLSGDWGKENPMGNYQKMVYCMRGADLPEITFGNKGKMPVRYILPKNFTNKQLTANNIVIEISGGSPTQSTGRCALITQSLLDRYECDMVCTNFCRAIKPKEGYSEFIYYYWRYLYEHNVMFLYENGTTGIKNLDISSFLENEKIIIPTLNSVHKFSNIVQKLRNTIATNGLEIEKLTNLRDTLLPKLLSGEISVNQATK